MKNTVCAVVVTYNRKKLLIKCIKSPPHTHYTTNHNKLQYQNRKLTTKKTPKLAQLSHYFYG